MATVSILPKLVVTRCFAWFFGGVRLYYAIIKVLPYDTM